MFIIVDNATSKVVGASTQELFGDENTTVHEVYDGTTIDDLLDSNGNFVFSYNGSSFVSLPITSIYPTIEGEEAMSMLRAERDRRIETQVDPLVTNILRWNDLSTADQTAVINHRNALLDITTNYPNAKYVWDEGSNKYIELNVTWPTLILGA